MIDEALAAATSLWPSVAVERSRFATFVASIGEAALARFGSDLVLACACTHGDPAALQVFEAQILTAARAAIRSIDRDESFVEEAAQRVRTHLLVGTTDAPARIATYAGRGPLNAWVAVAGARIALMMKRDTTRAREVDSDDWTTAITVASTGTPELDLIKRQHGDAFASALRDAARGLEPRLRSVLRMHFVDDLSLDEIGIAYAVHRATAGRWVKQAREALFDETRRLLTERLQLTSSELDRLTTMVQSQLDVSLSQLLPPDQP